jgi:hypothetical protein
MEAAAAANGVKPQIRFRSSKLKAENVKINVGTSLERIGDESVTPRDSGFVHGHI